jgi:hypothetical protein
MVALTMATVWLPAAGLPGRDLEFTAGDGVEVAKLFAAVVRMVLEASAIVPLASARDVTVGTT